MIRTIFPNAAPMSTEGWATRRVITLVKTVLFPEDPIIQGLSCLDECSFVASYKNRVYGHLTLPDRKFNDFSAYLQKRVLASDTIEFFLQKDNVDVATLNDNTYGEFFDFGDLPNPDFTGFKLEWQNVVLDGSLGEGCYRVRVAGDINGEAVEAFTEDFVLRFYQNELAERSTVFTWIQNGIILDGFDLGGFEWENSIRVKGEFVEIPFDTEIDAVELSNRKFEEITTQTFDNFEYRSHQISGAVYNLFKKNVIKGDSITVTDYNFFNPDTFIAKPIRFNSAEEVENLEQTKFKKMVLSWKPRTEDSLKRQDFT